MITQDQLKEVKERTEQLNRYLDIDSKKIQYEEEQLRTQAPGFWDDQKRAEAQMKLVKGLEKWIKGYAEVKTLCDELDTAFEFYRRNSSPKRRWTHSTPRPSLLSKNWN